MCVVYVHVLDPLTSPLLTFVPHLCYRACIVLGRGRGR